MPPNAGFGDAPKSGTSVHKRASATARRGRLEGIREVPYAAAPENLVGTETADAARPPPDGATVIEQ